MESKMFQAKWIAFQFVVAMLTFYWISTWADVTQYGLAPAAISMFVAFVATGLLVRFLDWRALRRATIRDELNGEHRGLLRTTRSVGNFPEQPSRLRAGKDIRELP